MQVPEGWQEKSVGQLFDVQLGKMLSPKAKENGEQYPYLTNTNVQWGRFNLSALNRMHFTAKEQKRFSLKYGDLVVCEGGEVGRCAIWTEKKICFYQKALHRLRGITDEVTPHYMMSYMMFVAGTKLLADYTSRTSIAHLTRENLFKLPVVYPPKKTQQKITEILGDWDQVIEKLDQLLAAKRTYKKGLMQQLLNGRVRFPEFGSNWQEYELGKLFNERRESNLDLPLLAITGKQGVVKRSELERKDTSNVNQYLRH